MSEHDDEHQDQDAGPGRLARDAAVQSLVTYGVYLAVALGFTAALASRERIRGAARYLAARWSAGRLAEDRTVSEFQRELSDRHDWGSP